ncbi:MAG TPA: NTP transferase domain-containing protein [Myxococcota bacterium]|nr:NTP transferase domain-containing protein [Myxococcota bacterium]
MAEPVDQAVILAAGQGIRLRKDNRDYLKPLYPLFDRPLISYVMSAFFNHGVKRFFVVVGFEAEELMPGIKEALPGGAELHFIDNPDWRLSNGVSLLKAHGHVDGRFFLSMSDHIFDPGMIASLQRGAGDVESLYLAVDAKIDTIFDMDDATKVKIDNGRIVDIDKKLTEFDAVDTGLFICPGAIFEHLQAAAAGGDCSLSDGVRKMAEAGKARFVDIGLSFWQDVDTPEMLSNAEMLLSRWKKLD